LTTAIMNFACMCNKDLLYGWNAPDAAGAGAAGLAIALIPADIGMVPLLVAGAVSGYGLDVLDQEVQSFGKPVNWNHAACASKMGFLSAIPVIHNQFKAAIWNVMSGITGVKGCEGY
jgi:hypothetical protein